MTLEEFERCYAERSKATVEWLHAHEIRGRPCQWRLLPVTPPAADAGTLAGVPPTNELRGAIQHLDDLSSVFADELSDVFQEQLETARNLVNAHLDDVDAALSAAQRDAETLREIAQRIRQDEMTR